MRPFARSLAVGSALAGFVLGAAALLPLGAVAQERRGERQVAKGQRFVVAAAAREASEAGVAILEAGGNVVDAAVAVTFAISVCRPQSTGLGGGGFFLVHDAKTGAVEALDARETAPASATRDMYTDELASLDGPKAVATPGLVAGVLDLHGRRGTKPLAEVLAPAIKLARDGIEVSRGLASACRERREVLAKDPEAARIFLPGGKPLVAGARFQQPDLARTLEAIVAEGRAGFYKGRVGEGIVKGTGGAVTLADLDEYQPKMRVAIRGTYRGHEVVSFPPPSSGGVHLVEMLNVLEVKAPGEGALAALTPTARAHLLVESMRRAYRDRAELLGDPDFTKVPVGRLVSKEYAQALAATIRDDAASVSSTLAPGVPRESGHTTHFSIVDAEGNAVASTQTVNYTLGACVVAPGTGVVLNDEMDDFAARPGVPNAYGLVGGEANAVAPGKRPLSSMTPTFVLGPRGENGPGRLEIALGSPGGSRIITAVLQTIVNRLDLDASPEESVRLPRIHHQWLPDRVSCEEGVPLAVREGLAKLGHTVAVVSPGSDIQAVFRLGAAELVGVSDPRAEGQPAGR